MGRRQENKKNNFKKVVLIFLIAVFVLGAFYLGYSFYNTRNKDNKENKNILESIVINEPEITDTRTKRMLQLEKLQEENNEIIGYLEIEGTNISYPVVQTNDNDFYLTHNYKKENATGGALFLDKDFDMINGSSNYLIYGHRMPDGTMFEDLIKYSDEKFYKEHTKIKFTTNNEDCIYEILAVFYSRVYYKSEKDVFRYYFFVNASNEAEYNDFVNNAKKASIYDTGVNAEYGDQLLTLSTCEYSREDGRFAIVAKKIK